MSEEKSRKPRLQREPDEKVAIRIKELRNNRGLSQEKLAEALQGYVSIHLGDKVGKTVVSNLETRKQNMTVELAIAYSKVFNVSLEYLLCLSDDWKPEHKTIKEVIGLSDKSIAAMKDIKTDSSPVDISGYIPPYIATLNILYETGFITKLLKSFERFIDRGVVHGKNTIWLDQASYPEKSTIRPDVWYLKNEIDDAVEAVIDTFVSEFSNQQ